MIYWAIGNVERGGKKLGNLADLGDERRFAWTQKQLKNCGGLPNEEAVALALFPPLLPP